MKTYVLMVSKVFPQYHPRKGEQTGFRDKILVTKNHTLRMNTALWEARAEEINTGQAILSVRQWSGKPYEPGSHQEEILQLTHLGTQRIRLSYNKTKRLWEGFVSYGKYEKRVNLARLAKNDGLSVEDFEQWFRLQPEGKDLSPVILHFTDMRY